MRAKIIIASVLSTIGLMLAAASPAAAQTYVPHYNEEGDYVGCTALATGHFFYPNEITELGCNTEPEPTIEQ